MEKQKQQSGIKPSPQLLDINEIFVNTVIEVKTEQQDVQIYLKSHLLNKIKASKRLMFRKWFYIKLYGVRKLTKLNLPKVKWIYILKIWHEA